MTSLPPLSSTMSWWTWRLQCRQLASQLPNRSLLLTLIHFLGIEVSRWIKPKHGTAHHSAWCEGNSYSNFGAQACTHHCVLRYRVVPCLGAATNVHRFLVPISDAHALALWRKNKVHDALSLMFQQKGVPPLMVMDYSKKHTLCKSHQRFRDTDCKLKTT